MSSSQHWLSERQPVWVSLEDTLSALQAPGARRRVDPQAVRALCLAYRAVAADLARAQSSPQCQYLVPYLNNLAQRLYGVTYASAPNRGQGLWAFWARTLPQGVRREAGFIWLACLTFALGTGLALITVAVSPDSSTFFLPAATIDQVAHGRLWMDGVDAAPSKASFLMTNNIRVAFQAYVGGLFAGVGSLLALFYNGLFAFGGPLGVCLRHGMAGPLMLFMAPHGVIELTTIFIAGGAGMSVGHAVLFPGERARWPHVVARARQSLVLVAGCVALLVLAGLIEGLVSLNQAVPASLRLGVSAASAVLLFAYLGLAGRQPGNRNDSEHPPNA